MALPPFDAEAANATVACVLPAVATPIVGASALPAGVTALEAVDAGPTPMPFVAVTVNVYKVPFVNPLTMIEEHGAVQLPVRPPGLLVAV